MYHPLNILDFIVGRYYDQIWTQWIIFFTKIETLRPKCCVLFFDFLPQSLFGAVPYIRRFSNGFNNATKMPAVTGTIVKIKKKVLRL